MSQIVNPVNRLTIQDLSAELVEMSEEELQHVFGGKREPKKVTVKPDGTVVVEY